MATLFLAPVANYQQKALNGAISDSVTTITLNNTTNLQTAGYLVIDRINSSGTATPNSREVITYTGISGNDLTGVTRGADSSTARSHNDAAIVEAVPTVGMWNNMATIVATGLDSNGYLKPLASPASLSILRIGTNLNTSGASLVGVFPSGASGSVLVSRTNSLPPVFTTLPRAKVITFTRDLTAASGNVSYTGTGFKPIQLIFLGVINTTTTATVGFGNATDNESISQIQDGTMTFDSTCLRIYQAAGAIQGAVIASLDADGFTLTWTKTGSPTGTGTFVVLAIG